VHVDTNMNRPSLPAAAVFAARAAQPDQAPAGVGDVARLLALVLVGVPPGLDEVIVRVRQGFLAYPIKPHPCRGGLGETRALDAMPCNPI